MMRHALVMIGLLAFCPTTFAGTPSEQKVSKDVTRKWKKQWPELEVAHVARKTECQKVILEVPSKVLGKTRKLKTCQVDVDVYISVGYRYHIYRATQAHYQRNRLVRLIQGKMEKVWKAGGVPVPSPEQAKEWLKAQATSKLGAGWEITITETGKPRIFGEVFRLTYIVEAKGPGTDGKEEIKKSLMATFESDGGDWKPVADLSI